LIPEIYLKYGFKGLTRLQGEYNFIILEPEQGRVTCISSQFGLLPLYYAMQDNRLLISTELRLVALAGHYTTLNKAVLAQICLYNYSLSDDSLMHGCYVLAPGTIMSYSDGKLESDRYWLPQQLLGKDIMRGNRAVDLVEAAFDKAIASFANQAAGCALSLTGGWDGRLALAFLLDHMSAADIKLYSFGTPSSPDVTIPGQIARQMGLDYQPILLDQEYLDKDYLDCARATALHSDGYRSIQRAHYYHAMHKLSDYSGIIVSGICGSNVMKTAANSPSVVINRRILELINGGDTISILRTHYQEICSILPDRFNSGDFDAFADAVYSKMMADLLREEVYSQRMSVFIFSYLERKYFGAELASYKHLMANFSPFINSSFIETLSQTEYFNAHKSSRNLFSNWGNGILYAKLIHRHNPSLTRFQSDKYVSLSELLNPLNYPVIAAKQIYRRRIRSHLRKPDYYNTGSTIAMFIESNPGLMRAQEVARINDRNMLGSILSALYWYSSLDKPLHGLGET